MLATVIVALRLSMSILTALTLLFVVLLLGRDGRARLTLLGIISTTTAKTILESLLLDLIISELGQLLSGADVGHVFAVSLGEDKINLFQTAAGSLRVEEDHGRNEGGVHDGEEKICSPVNVLDHNRGDHDHGEVKKPVRAGRYGVGLGTSPNWRDLSGIQPRKRKDGCAEECHVKEESEDSALGGTRAVRDQAAEHDDHGDHLAGHTTDEKLATTDLFNEEPGECGEYGVDDHVDTTDEKRHEFGLIEGLFKKDRQVVNYSIATGQLLRDL